MVQPVVKNKAQQTPQKRKVNGESSKENMAHHSMTLLSSRSISVYCKHPLWLMEITIYTQAEIDWMYGLNICVPSSLYVESLIPM